MTGPRLTALTPEGTRLPVIDITDPAFGIADGPVDVAALEAAALTEEARRGLVQRALFRFVLKSLARKSRLIAALQAANSGYLSGIPTYVMKLGADNLMAPYDSAIDRRVAATPIAASMRIRLFQVARLLAEGLAPALAADEAAPLDILEIAGGPSADGLNALILLAGKGLLAQRRTHISVYDLDTEGPAFALNLLAALRGGPLAGLDIGLTHIPGNWGDPGALGKVLAGIPSGAIVAATSEGGLFEYGSDADITGVLRTLAPRVGVVTGSVTRNERINGLMRRHSSSNTVPRGLDRFAELIAPAGYGIAQSSPAVLSDQVLLTRP